MLKRMEPEIPIILSVVAQFLAVLAALWLIWPLRLGPIAYSDANVSIVDAGDWAYCRNCSRRPR